VSIDGTWCGVVCVLGGWVGCLMFLWYEGLLENEMIDLIAL